MTNEFLPIGTVILLNDSEKKFMITGYLPIIEKEKIIFDYCGCAYPEGYMTSNSNALFNRPDIKQVVFMGPKDDPEFKTFLEKLNVLYKEIEKQIQKGDSEEKK